MGICVLRAVQMILGRGITLISHSLALSMVWILVPLLPLGTVAYVLKYYRKHCGSVAVWTGAAIVGLGQMVLFALSFAFLPSLAFFVNIVALPFEYYLLDRGLRGLGIVGSIDRETK
jgi:hypothetical protein